MVVKGLFPPDAQSSMSQVNGISRSWHKIKTPSALSWFEPNPNLFKGVKTSSHIGLVFLSWATLLPGAGQHHTEVLWHEPFSRHFKFCQKKKKRGIGNFVRMVILRRFPSQIPNLCGSDKHLKCTAKPSEVPNALISNHISAQRPQSNSECNGLLGNIFCMPAQDSPTYAEMGLEHHLQHKHWVWMSPEHIQFLDETCLHSPKWKQPTPK